MSEKSNIKYKKLKEKHLSFKDSDTGFKKKVILKTFEQPNGFVETFFIDDDKDSVQIFAINTENMVCVVKQFRPGTEKVELELPGGGKEIGEDPLSAALRELEEETAWIPGQIHHLASKPYSPYSKGIRHMYMAVNCTKKEDESLNLDPNEHLTVHKISIDDCLKLALKAEIRGWDSILLGLHKLGYLDRTY